MSFDGRIHVWSEELDSAADLPDNRARCVDCGELVDGSDERDGDRPVCAACERDRVPTPVDGAAALPMAQLVWPESDGSGI